MSISYCTFSHSHPLHQAYHDLEYGFPIYDDDMLFARLMLEINQAGLSWQTVLKKKEAFFRAYANFEIDRVAAFTEQDQARLLQDASIIRNRLKVQAAIENARRIQALRKQFGSFAHWLDHHHPLTRLEWQKLFKRTFVFTGGEIVGEFLISTGYLPGAHDVDCHVYKKILVLNPPWQITTKA